MRHWPEEKLILSAWHPGLLRQTRSMPSIMRCPWLYINSWYAAAYHWFVQERCNSSALGGNELKSFMEVHNMVSLPWLLMNWQHKEPGHQQPCINIILEYSSLSTTRVNTFQPWEKYYTIFRYVFRIHSNNITTEIHRCISRALLDIHQSSFGWYQEDPIEIHLNIGSG